MRVIQNPRRYRTGVKEPHYKERGWSKLRYANAVKNLRKVLPGFTAPDGFNLHEFDEWSPSQKRKVRRAFTDPKYDYEGLFSRPHHIVRFRKTQRDLIEAAQEVSGHKRVDPRAFAAIPPAVDRHAKAEFRFRKGKRPILVERGARGRVTRTETIRFDLEQLAVGGEAYLEQIMAPYLEKEGFWSILNGQNTFDVGGSFEKTIEEIMMMMERYEPDTHAHSDPDDPGSHHWTNWLHGLRFTHSREPQDARVVYRMSKREQREENKARLEKERIAAQRQRRVYKQVRRRKSARKRRSR